jgi:hypothetical protein
MMKSFIEFKENPTPIFEAYEVEGLTESEIQESERIYRELATYIKENGIENLDEGILGKIIGGLTGFVIGPAVGKIIANALGIDTGILYDMFTSRLVSAALGATLAKNLV